ncbi:MAG: hypothetical protein ACRDZ8_17790 [Acidimicrobiales bacterium]
MNTSPSSHTTAELRAKLHGWFAGQIPDGWFTTAPTVTFDNDEILVVGALKAPDLGADAGADETAEAQAARIQRFREDTREQRMRIAEDAQRRFRRRVSWGATCGDVTQNFSTASVPVMTRLRMPERAVLDTLIDAGVARSRSDALAWCVRLVGRNEAAWIDDLRAAFEHVESVRAQGPSSVRGEGADAEATESSDADAAAG